MTLCALKPEAYLTKRLSIERSAFIIAISFETSREPREANEVSTIASLKEAGLTFRQIERLTGIGRGIIQNIKTH